MTDERYVVNIETHDGKSIFRGRVNALGLSEKIGTLAHAAVIAEEEDPPQLLTLPDVVTRIRRIRAERIRAADPHRRRS